MPEPTKTTRTRTRSSNSRTIPLRSGGTLTLAGTFNFLDMSGEDRDLVIDLAQRMTVYQNQPAPPSPGPPAKVTGPKTN